MAGSENWDDYQPESGGSWAGAEAERPDGFSLSGEAYVEETHTVGGGSSTDREEVGGGLTVDYPDAWDGADGDGRVSVTGEVHHEETRTIEDGTATDHSSWGGDLSVDY
ncbi:hypothetical protein KNE206_37050 [Kitasatospora sp. NE20-6]|uniref:hypothetical protein n=1 Tax=Kitasatospora sp. NE20-6 TaxID=2859066 RepID=UPI0034DCA177